MTSKRSQEFIIELGKALHRFGAAAQHAEGALSACAEKLIGGGDILVTPTAMMLAFPTPDGQDHHLIRLDSGGIDLGRLSAVDAIADRVLSLELTPAEGVLAIKEVISTPYSFNPLIPLAFVTSSTVFCGVFGGSVKELLATAGFSFLLWVLSLCAQKSQRFSGLTDFLGAFMASLLAEITERMGFGIRSEMVTLSSLVVLIPGLSITVAMMELSTRNLIAGTARLAGASVELVRLVFGVILGHALANLLPLSGTPALVTSSALIPEILVCLLASASFGILFHAAQKDFLAIMVVGVCSFFSAHWGAQFFHPQLGVFFGGMVLSALGNSFARLFQKPSLIVVIPGLLPLVPGSMGYRSLSYFFLKDISSGLEAFFLMLTVFIALVAGLAFGHLIVMPRRCI